MKYFTPPCGKAQDQPVNGTVKMYCLSAAARHTSVWHTTLKKDSNSSIVKYIQLNYPEYNIITNQSISDVAVNSGVASCQL